MNAKSLEEEILRDYDVAAGADSLLLELDGEVLFHRGGSKHSVQYIWAALKAEVHLLLCTEDSKYSKERASLRSTAAPAIAVLSGFLVQTFGLSAGTAGTLAAVALLIPLRVATRAWCRLYSSQQPSAILEEKKILRELSGTRRKRKTQRAK